MKRLGPVAPWALALGAALYVATILNVGFYRHTHGVLSAAGSKTLGIMALMVVLLVALNAFLLFIVGHPRILRPTIVLSLIVAAPLSYFANEYGLGIDHRLLATALETDRAEARDLITLKLVAWVLVLGVLPTWLVWRLDLKWPPLLQRLKINATAMLVSALTFAAALGASYGDLTSLFREQRQLMAMIAPLNGLAAVTTYTLRSAPLQRAPGQLARIAPAVRAGGPGAQPAIFVIVVGETARGDHFSINGYGRETTPRLAAIPDLINFPSATSCATLTADSLPCMFSGLGREGNVRNIAHARENLLDVVKGAGFDVLWVDNQSGCKALCKRVETIDTTVAKDPRFCATGECHDEILVATLADRLKTMTRDTVIVLHMMGSHGPAYWKRYPAAFEHFTPACKSSAFSSCKREEIVAAYDNTLRYSDHVLGEIIDLLAKSARPAAMIYASDHGESLGERGVYLHGVPFMLAPRAQTHIPFLAWMSASYRTRFNLAADCLKTERKRDVSHDHFFHSILGLLDLRTPARDPALDLTRSCRAPD